MTRPPKVRPPLENGSLTVTKYTDMNEMSGRIITIYLDGHKHQIKFGRLQCEALGAALKGNGRDLVMRPGGETYHPLPGELDNQ